MVRGSKTSRSNRALRDTKDYKGIEANVRKTIGLVSTIKAELASK